MPAYVAFSQMNYPIIGESYKSPYLPISAQRTLNMWPEAIKGEKGLTNTAAHHFPGLKLSTSGSAGEYDRGSHVFNDKLYVVSGGAMYLVTASGVRTNIGSINGTSAVSISDNGATMVIVTGNEEYTYNGTTLTGPTSITGANTPTNVEFLNRQFWYDGNDGFVGISDVGLTTVSAGSYFEPESTGNPLVRTYIFNQTIYLFTSGSIEPWQYEGQVTPAAIRIENGIVEDVGLAGRKAIAHTEKAMYFVSDKGEAKQMQGYQPNTISTVAVANEWSNYTISNALVQTIKYMSLDFVIFTFPTDSRTWGYVEQYDFWFELSHGVSTGNSLVRWLGNTIQRVYGKTMVTDYSSGNLYELDKDTYTNNGVVTARERVLESIGGEKLGKPRQRFQLSEIKFGVSVGVGNAAEQKPLLGFSMSFDGGNSFGSNKFLPLGAEGIQPEVSTNSNKHFLQLAIKLRLTEPTAFSLFSCGLVVREAGR